MPLEIGERLGPYEIIALLGRGGMGEVYRARDTRLNRDVAIKVSPDRFSERFDREARAIAALNHPNICTLFDVGPNYLVMEYVEGEPLSARMKGGALPLDEALEIAQQVIAALEAAHDKLITHRDLKPGNVMLKPDGVVKVLDFGLAKFGGSAPTSISQDSPTLSMAATQAGVILGTAAYMAPEQARGKPVDKRADIWAFGVLLHEMVTGRRAFEGEDLTETLAAVVMKEPDLSTVPDRIKRVLQRCLEKDPKKRLRDITGVALLLEDSPAPAPLTIAAEQPPAKPASKLLWIVAAIFATAAAVLAILYLRQPPPTASQSVRFDIPPPVAGDNLTPFVKVSPDGSMVAFTTSKLWVRRLDSLEPRPIEGTDGVGGFFWAPDDRFVLFVQGGKLRKADINGGPSQVICDQSITNVGGGFFTADRRIIFGTPAAGGIQQCPAAGGPAAQVTAFKTGGQEVYHAFPVLLPDAKHFLFGRSAGPDSGVFVGFLDASPDQQTTHRLLPGTVLAVYAPATADGRDRILFNRDGSLMTQEFHPDKPELAGEPELVAGDLRNSYSFSASPNGTLAFVRGGRERTNLMWLSEGRPGAKVGNPIRPLSALRLSPDTKRATGHRGEAGGQSDIWIVDTATGSETRLTTDASGDTNPVWSPDGARIVFTSNRDGGENLYLRNADGSGADELLLKTAERKTPLHWSSNGYLLFRVINAKGADLWVLPMNVPPAERKPIPYLQTDAIEGTSARFSPPDGKYIAYVSNVSGRDEAYVRPFDPSKPESSNAASTLVSRNGATQVFWRGDGKELYYREISSSRAMAMNVSLAPVFKAEPPHEAWTTNVGIFSADVAPDAKRIFAEVSAGNEQQGITVITNWQSLLRK